MATLWNRFKARWRSHDDALATRELNREAVQAEAGDAVTTVVSPYLDQPAQPSTGFTHPERGDEDSAD